MRADIGQQFQRVWNFHCSLGKRRGAPGNRRHWAFGVWDDDCKRSSKRCCDGYFNLPNPMCSGDGYYDRMEQCNWCFKYIGSRPSINDGGFQRRVDADAGTDWRFDGENFPANGCDGDCNHCAGGIFCGGEFHISCYRCSCCCGGSIGGRYYSINEGVQQGDRGGEKVPRRDGADEGEHGGGQRGQ